MIKGISYLSFENGLANTQFIESALAQTKTYGFDVLELGISTEGVLTTKISKAECAQIRKTINESGIFVDDILSNKRINIYLLKQVAESAAIIEAEMVSVKSCSVVALGAGS